MKTLSENSTFRVTWDFFIVILILVSCWLIPFQLAFRHMPYRLDTKIIYLIDLFFIIDILINFFTSYRYEGTEITDIKKTTSHYLGTFFLIDLLANFPLDAFFLGNDDIQFLNVPVVLILRAFRLLRVVRLFVIFSRWQQASWTNSGYLRILKFFVAVMLLIHWIGCAWFLLAFIDDFPHDCWVVTMGIKEADSMTQYVRSLYWAIVTMTTVGYGDITPNRNIEYVFTMLVMLLGASMYAFIIGNIASLFSSIDSARASFWNRIEALNQYLRSRQVPSVVNKQVRNYYEYLWARHRGVREDALFDDLPVSFRLDILQHLTRDLLEKVPLFKYCSATLKNVLLMALKPQTYPPDGYIVREGEVGEEIYFIGEGIAEITSDEGKNIHGTLEGGDYFGDLSFILGEKRTASVRALTYCEVFVLTRNVFDRIKNEYPELKNVLKEMSSRKTDKVSALVLDGVIL
jgi:hypothetical protein